MFPINNRIKDVIIALNVAEQYNQELGRLGLQKFIYLADIISLYWGMLNICNGHETYKRGPYDYDIQNSVDVLAFRGFVSISQSNIKEDGSVTASYVLSKFGKLLFKELEKNRIFKTRIELFTSIGYHVEKRGWRNLKALVYLEPTYCFAKNNGWGYRLDYSSLLSNDTLRILDGFRKMLNSDKMENISKENFTSIFFKILEAKLEQ